MPRIVQLSVPQEVTTKLVEELQKMNGLIGLRVQKGISLKPKGDVISMEITNRKFSNLMELLSMQKLVDDVHVSVSTSEPNSIISKSSQSQITTDVSEAIWEEMQATINKQSGMTVNMLLTMFLVGVIAVVGIITNALHIVVAAMVLAPAFEPITRISLGLVSTSVDWKNGLADTVKGYLLLLAGALFGALILYLLGKDLSSGDTTYLPRGVLLQYWTSITVTSLVVDIAAAMIGALLIVTHRSVLTAGVMIALALVPATAIAGIGIVATNWDMVAQALLRLLVEISIVATCTAIIFLWKKNSIHKRKMFR